MEMDLWPVFDEVRKALPDSIKTALAAAAGAIFGAWLSGRSRTKKEIVDELKAVRTAFAVAVTICNKAMALKRQHIAPMNIRYDAAVAAYQTEAKKPSGKPHLVSLDLAIISPTKFPDDILAKLIFEKSSIGEKGVIISLEVSTAIENLNYACDFRTGLIEEIRKEPTLTQEQLAQRYLGIENSPGMIDARFPHSMEMLSLYLDDCIFFSKLLSDELLRYGRKLRNRNWWKYRLSVGKMKGADWSMAERENLIPPAERYSDWTRIFKKQPTMIGSLKEWFANCLPRRRDAMEPPVASKKTREHYALRREKRAARKP
jgi:hypothetical protein